MEPKKKTSKRTDRSARPIPSHIPKRIAAQIKAQREGKPIPAPAPVEEPVVEPAPPSPPPAEVELDELDALRLSRASTRRALGELRMAKLEQETELIAAQANARIAEIGRQVEDLAKVVGEEKKRERQLFEALAAKHGLDPQAYTFHEDTGRLLRRT